MTGLSIEIIPFIENSVDLPVDGSMLLAFSKFNTNGDQFALNGQLIDRFLLQFVGGDFSVPGLPPGWQRS